MAGLEVRTERGRKGYWVGSDQYPRVTAILDTIHKPALERWKLDHEQQALYEAAVSTFDDCVESGICSSVRYRTMLQYALATAKKAERAQIAAAEAGTRVHAHIAARLKGEPRPEGLSDVELIQSDYAIDWLQEVGAEIIEVETPVYYDVEGHRYAGTPDAVIDTPDGKRAIIDWKTGAGKIWKSYFLQNIAYRRAWNWVHRAEQTTAVTGGMIVKLPQVPDELPEVAQVSGDDELFLVFMACLRVYEWEVGDE
jgi:hypothetical protein